MLAALLNLATQQFEQLNVLGSLMGSPQDFAGLLALVNAARIVPHVSRRFGLNAIGDAFAWQAGPQRLGKTVLEIS